VQHPSFRSVIGRFILQFLVPPVKEPSAISLMRFPIVGRIPSARHRFHDDWAPESNTSAQLIIANSRTLPGFDDGLFLSLYGWLAG
jgi:hypothetical protein